jgi:membrane protein DedA with SNARE-associated domain
MPFKIFVATAGALEYPRWKFMTTIMIARSVRYFVEGTLAVFYGERVIEFMRVNGLYIVSGVASLVVIGVCVYVVARRIRAPRLSAVEVAEGKAEGARPGGEAAD